MFERLRKKKINNIIIKLNKKSLVKRYLLLLVGLFIAAFAYNLFFLRYGIVCFGVSGISIVLNEFGVNPTIFMFIANIILLFISFLVLGYDKTKNSILGSLLFPVFVTLTAYLTEYIKLDNVELIVVAIFGAVLSGLGYGLVFKAGFTTGGTDILNQILVKYMKVSMGNAMIIIDGLVVLSAKLAFSWEIVLYGFIVLYMISVITDKVILGISQSKAFYIVTEKKDLVKEFLLSITDGGVTIVDARGGYTNNKTYLLLGVVPTKQYFWVKEGLKEIDNNIFFLACDTYEVSNKGDRDESF